MSSPRIEGVALAHDWLVGMRGGEWVLDRLARLFGPTDLYPLVDDGRFLTEAIARCRVITSPLQRFPGAAGAMRRAYLPVMPWAVERLRVKPSVGWASPTESAEKSKDVFGKVEKNVSHGTRAVGDAHPTRLLISTSSAVMKSIVAPPGVPHLCYCHSPARYIWEQGEDYAGGRGGRMRAMGLRAVRKRFQEWDRRTAQSDRVTKFIANSSHTAARILRCYGREATVIHPPVRTEFFTPDVNVQREEWLLVVGALEPYKRTEIVIDAAKRGGFTLKIAGIGSQYVALRRRAQGGAIEFLGRVDDATLRDLYRRAKALVFPQVEDFGIIAAEAQACGCPVSAYAMGGAMDIVTDRTGVLMREQTPEAVIEAVGEVGQAAIQSSACRESALRFSEARFDEAMVRQARALLDETPHPRH